MTPPSASDPHAPADRQGADRTEDSASQEFWEKHYAGMDDSWGRRPNVVLAEVVEGLQIPPGRALDLGCGHGGDVLWLASLGWQVTGTDVSATALTRVRANATAAGVLDRITLERHDLSRSLPHGPFDLVCATYFHTPVDIPRARILRSAADKVRPGGHLVIIEHASFAPWSWRPDDHPGFPSPQETLAALHLPDTWERVTAAAPQRLATGPSGEQAMVTDNIVVVRRQT